jgi:AcrR family transcriptional regulator
VLDAARDCFAEGDPQMLDIARRAGVGVGTVYRHFANKDELMAALALDCIGEVHGHAVSSLEVGDPWAGFERFVWCATGKLASDQLSVDALATQAQRKELEQRSAALSAAIVVLAERARAAGALRQDMSGEQVDSILRHLGGAIRGAERTGFDWRSYVRVVLDGLRADGPA